MVPVADVWGADAAALIYSTAIEVDGVTVTAKVLKGAVESLPEGEFDAEAVAESIRTYLSSLPKESNADGKGAIDIAARAEKAVSYSWVRRLASKDRAAAAEYLDAMQRQIDKCRAELLPSDQS